MRSKEGVIRVRQDRGGYGGVSGAKVGGTWDVAVAQLRILSARCRRGCNGHGCYPM